MSGELTREERRRIRGAAELLLEARRTCKPLVDLPGDVKPQTLEEAYGLQDEMALAFAPLGGWKVGAPSPEATPVFAPMPFWGGYMENGDVLGPQYSRLRGLEAEIAFLLGEDLPARATPYTRDEVTQAVATVHPAIEILESGFIDPDEVDRLSMIGDLQINGGFAYGPAFAGWQTTDWSTETVELTVDGAVRKEGGMGNTAGPDLLRLLVWLANEGAARTGGLKAGQWITTGSWTGKEYGSSCSTVRARFGRAGVVSFTFA
jgi:2-keto-4-pentenoate hydratase